MILAEASNEFMGAWVYALLALLGGAGAAAGIYFGFRKSPPVKLQDDPEINVRKAPKRFNHELAEQRYGDHERRIVVLEKAHTQMIEKLDADKAEIMQSGEDRKDELQAQINNMPDRIVALLRNLGAIK